ncbi:MAG: hypothetical protein MJB14_12315 [Spirochaetes bacterium]|nr:hypothetical protein [Spirochaetota bacterium]
MLTIHIIESNIVYAIILKTLLLKIGYQTVEIFKAEEYIESSYYYEADIIFIDHHVYSQNFEMIYDVPVFIYKINQTTRAFSFQQATDAGYSFKSNLNQHSILQTIENYNLSPSSTTLPSLQI